jgi:predicted nuclease of predicted toxin-antitoxin system
LSLRLLVDEDTLAKALVAQLRKAGHDVVIVHEAGLSGKSDESVLEYARREDRLVLTRNCEEFRALHAAQPDPPGIGAIYQDRDPSKNMTYAEIVRALANLEASGLELAGQFLVLNAWNY